MRQQPNSRTTPPSNNRPRQVGPNLRCFGCGRNHHVLDCTVISATRRQELFEQRATLSQNQRSSNPSTNNRTSSRPTQSAQAASQVPTSANSVATTPVSNTSNTASAHPNGQYNAPLHLANTATIIDPLIPQEFCLIAHGDLPYINYEDGVILDSGATSHMSGDKRIFIDMEPYIAGVLIADGTISQTTHRGTINVKVFDSKTQREQINPLKESLLVPGFRYTLWSVGQFDREGHGFTFGNNQVRLNLNLDTHDEQVIILPPPFAFTRNNSTYSEVANMAFDEFPVNEFREPWWRRPTTNWPTLAPHQRGGTFLDGIIMTHKCNASFWAPF